MQGIYLIRTPLNQKLVKYSAQIQKAYNKFINNKLYLPKATREELKVYPIALFEFRVLKVFKEKVDREVLNTYLNLYKDLHQGRGEIIKGVPKYTLIEEIIEPEFSVN